MPAKKLADRASELGSVVGQSRCWQALLALEKTRRPTHTGRGSQRLGNIFHNFHANAWATGQNRIFNSSRDTAPLLTARASAGDSRNTSLIASCKTRSVS